MREMLCPPRRGGLRTQGGAGHPVLPPAPARSLSLHTQPLERGNAEPGLFRKAISRQERKGRGGKLGGWGAEEENWGAEERKEIGSTPERQSSSGKNLLGPEREFTLVTSLPSGGH